MVSAGQNYVFFGTSAFSYRIKNGVSAMFKICLDIFAFFRGVVSPLSGVAASFLVATVYRLIGNASRSCRCFLFPYKAFFPVC